MEDLKGHQSIICNQPVWNKCTLILIDYLVQNELYSISKDFGNNLSNDIA